MTGPCLAIVVDTEEEFDWTKPFSRGATGTSAIPAQARAHELYDELGVVPTYVTGYPVARDEASVRFLGELKASGRASIGAHLHPWVTPPHEEEVTRHNSYHCNLPPELERAKIVALTDALTQAFGERPTIFKAGRYGFGPNTRRVLMDLGYRIDCSMVPNASFAADGGPGFYGRSEAPFWIDREHRLLEIPLTNGHFGALAAMGRYIQPLFDSRLAARLRLPSILLRSRLISRARLSPEGIPAGEQCALLRSLVARGRRVFTLTYHSPSLAPGNTPYVRDQGELADFLASIDIVLRYFRDDLGGRFTTLSQIHADHAAALTIETAARTN